MLYPAHHFAYKLNKQGDNIQPWHTASPIWNQSVVPCLVLTIVSWSAYRFLRRQVRWSGMLLLLLLLLRHFSSVWSATVHFSALCNPIDGSPPASSIPRILQARILEQVAISFSNACMHAKLLQSCPTLCNPMDSSPPGLLCPQDSPGKNTGVDCHFLLQWSGIPIAWRVFPFVVIHTVKGFGVINKAEVDFLELSCFFSDSTDVGNLISGSSVFFKFSLNIWNFSVHILLKLSLENFKLECEMNAIVQ